MAGEAPLVLEGIDFQIFYFTSNGWMDELINGWMDGWTWKYEIRQIYGGLLGSGGEAVSNYNLQIWATPAVTAVYWVAVYIV